MIVRELMKVRRQRSRMVMYGLEVSWFHIQDNACIQRESCPSICECGGWQIGRELKRSEGITAEIKLENLGLEESRYPQVVDPHLVHVYSDH